MRRLLPLLLLFGLVCSTGCTSTLDIVDEALVHERRGSDAKERERWDEAAGHYAEGMVVMARAYDSAAEEGIAVWTSFCTAKLSTMAKFRAYCRRPDVNTGGDWEEARALYVDSSGYARRGGFLAMERLGLKGQAECRRPDMNPKGTWESARELYEKGAALSKQYDDDSGRAEMCRLQALCLMEGDLSKKLSPAALKLLQRSRKLGDEESAEILSDSQFSFCKACGAVLPAEDDRYCKKCGHDQTKPGKPPKKERKLSGPGTEMREKTGPGGPGKPD
jgi:hypothetical protein